MKTIKKEYQLFTFKELDQDIQEKVISKLYDINVDYDWFEFIYDDAKNIGISIKAFDIDRASYCKIELNEMPRKVATLIMENHGETCETYKTALSFIESADNLDIDLDGYDDRFDDLVKEFTYSLAEDYRILLSQEYEYLTSEKAIIETIEANEYNFLKDGTMFNE